MDLLHLRTFVSVVELGTVSKAALRLRVAQPAPSRQITALEAELGSSCSIACAVACATGQVSNCCGIAGPYWCARIAQRARATAAARDAGELKVRATPQMIDGVFATFLHRYAKRYPGVQIKVTEAWALT